MDGASNSHPVRRAKSEVEKLPHSAPVFILGSPCSDASLLATSLTASDDFWCSTESHLFYYFVGPDERGRSKLHSAFANATRDPSFWLPRNRVVFPEFAAYVGLGLDQLFRSRSNNKRWVEASPENTLIASELTYMFPKAKFLTLIRDGRDVVSLMLELGLASDTEAGFAEACELWRIYGERILEFQARFPQRVLEVRHEQLIHGTKQQARGIMSFLTNDDTAAVAAFLDSEVKALRERLWNDWRLDRREVFEKTAGDMLTELGYTLEWD